MNVVNMMHAQADFSQMTKGIDDVNIKLRMLETLQKAHNVTLANTGKRWGQVVGGYMKAVKTYAAHGRAIVDTTAKLRGYFSATMDAERATMSHARAVISSNAAMREQAVLSIKGSAISQGQYSGRVGAVAVRPQDVKVTKQQAQALMAAANAGNFYANGMKLGAKETQKATVATKGLLLSWQSLVRLLTIQVLHQGVSLLVSSLRESAQEAGVLQLKLAEIVAISDKGRLALEDWGQALRGTSEKYGVSMLDLSEAAYQTVSNQIAQGLEAVKFVETASVFAMASVSSHTEAVNALASVINAYKMEAEDANDVSAKLFETIKLGRLRATDLAGSLGQITPIAFQLGVSINELLGSLASLTVLGMDTSEAVTQMRNIFQKLLIPTKEMLKLFDKLGIVNGQQLIQTYGLAGAFEAMQKHANGNISTLTKLINRIRGMSAAMEFTDIRGIARLRRYVSEIAKSGQEYQKRAAQILATQKKVWDKEINSIKNVFLLDVGPKMLKFLNSTSEAVGGFHNQITALIAVLKLSFIPVLGLILRHLAMVHPWIMAITAAVALTTFAIGKIISWQKETVNAVKDARLAWEKYAMDVDKALKKSTETAMMHADTIQQTFARIFEKWDEESTTAIKETEKVLKSFSDVADDLFSNVFTYFKDDLSDIDSIISNLNSEIADYSKTITQLRRGADQQMMAFRLQDIGDDISGQMQERLNASKKYLASYNKAVKRGDFENMQYYFGLASSQFIALRDAQVKLKKDEKGQIKILHDLQVEYAQTDKTDQKIKLRQQISEAEAALIEIRSSQQRYSMDFVNQYYTLVQKNEQDIIKMREAAQKKELAAEAQRVELVKRETELRMLHTELSDNMLRDMIQKPVELDPAARSGQLDTEQRALIHYKGIISRMIELLEKQGYDPAGFLIETLANKLTVMETAVGQRATDTVPKLDAALKAKESLEIFGKEVLTTATKLVEAKSMLDKLLVRYDKAAYQNAQTTNEPFPMRGWQKWLIATNPLASLASLLGGLSVKSIKSQDPMQIQADYKKLAAPVIETIDRLLEKLILEKDITTRVRDDLSGKTSGLFTSLLTSNQLLTGVNTNLITAIENLSVDMTTVRNLNNGSTNTPNTFMPIRSGGAPTPRPEINPITFGDIIFQGQQSGNAADARAFAEMFQRNVRQNMINIPLRGPR